MKPVKKLLPGKGFVSNDPALFRFALSIDPGEHIGWALWDWGSSARDWESSALLYGCGVGDPSYLSTDKWESVRHEDKVRILECVIEMPQVYPRSRGVPPNDIVKLAFTAGRLAETMWLRSLGGVRTMTPHEWKGVMPKDVCRGRILAHLSQEEMSIFTKACESFPKGQQHDVVDAIGIGLVAFRGVRL
jgi:hypothetical protein